MLPTPEEVQAMLRAEPYQPLQVRVADGTSYIITHPRLTLVTQQRLIIGFPEPGTNGQIAGDAVRLGWSMIAGIDRLVPEGSAR
jgi:hypothetical protein